MSEQDDCVAEDDCSVCGKWPEKDRWALREMTNSLRLDEEVCDACLTAFFSGLIAPGPTGPTRH
jgi:hypothetical protein